MSRKILGPLVVILFLSAAAYSDGGKVEAIGAASDPGISESVKKAIEPKGYRVTLANGTAHCEIWLRAGVPAGKTDAPGAVYSNIEESTLVGVINFPKGTNDFRGQSVKAGTYTLRYALHPADGNHLGISPIRDFLLLVPVTVDQNAEARYKFEELAKMSAKASGTNHPAVISLTTPDSGASGPAVSEDERGHVVFAAKLKSQSGADLPLAFVVKGIAEQ